MATNINQDRPFALIGTPLSQVIIGDIQVEASISEEHSLRGRVTSHKVEKGIDVTDNYRAEPKRIKINGVISNTMLIDVAASSEWPDTLDSNKMRAAGNKSPIDEIWKRLKQMFELSEVITIQTSLDTYQNMALEALTVARGSHNGDNLRFSATAKELRFVETGYAPPVKLPKETRGKKEGDNGTQTNKPTTEEAKKKASQSILLREKIAEDKLELNAEHVTYSDLK